MTTAMHIERRVTGPAVIVEITGSVDIFGVSMLRQEMQRCLEESDAHVIVNLAGVESMYSSGIGVLISFTQQFGKHGRKLVLACSSPVVRHVLGLTKLDGFFQMFDTEEAALRALGS